jgi:F-type H+-transporting ATPase subunit b
MDAGTSDSVEEGYRHSKVVRALAGYLHQPVERTAQIFEDANSGLVLLVIAYFLVKYLPRSFRAKRDEISKDLREAESATHMANERLRVVEARLQSLDSEIEALRQKAAEDAETDRKRIEASLEAERARIVHAAEQEIAAAGAHAQRELKQFAADLALQRAASRITLTPEQDRALIDEFTGSLAAQMNPDGRRN